VKIQKEVDEDTLIASDEKEDDNESKSSWYILVPFSHLRERNLFIS
jgi:hypothetical protein